MIALPFHSVVVQCTILQYNLMENNTIQYKAKIGEADVMQKSMWEQIVVMKSVSLVR